MFIARIDARARSLPPSIFCDAWLVGSVRFGDELAGLEHDHVIGRWPGELETDAFMRLAQIVGERPTWDTQVQTPPVAQRLAERARPLPLDREIVRHLQHLQHVCHRPRLHLRVEEERLPVSRARRTPVRAVADLVSHPGDWEHRTFQSIQPSRVLARQIEDEWNLYENRVAARLVDHLLAYLAKRMEELRKIKEILDGSRDHSDEIRQTSFWRACRISELWSKTLDSKTEEELSRTMKRLELAQRELQALLDAPLYQRVPRRQVVALSLKPTNILVNDPHYRKVAALWRSWVKFGHKRQETVQQRALRRQREAAAWDRFVLHLVARGFNALGWSSKPVGDVWELTKAGWSPVQVAMDAMGVVRVGHSRQLRLLPICADLTGAEPNIVQAQIELLDDPEAEVVIAHVGGMVALTDTDRASGWSIARRAVLFPCSPWGIDSEERMARLLHGWICRAASPAYPVSTSLSDLPRWQERWEWLRYENNLLAAFRAPNDLEVAEARNWARKKLEELDTRAQQAKAAKQRFDVAPREAVTAFQRFVDHDITDLIGMEICPVCSEKSDIELRPGKSSDGSDATWWVKCRSCASEWGTRPCTGCGTRYRVLVTHIKKDTSVFVRESLTGDWPDKVFGRDLWAQPCLTGALKQFRCPECGQCGNTSCTRCVVV